MQAPGTCVGCALAFGYFPVHPRLAVPSSKSTRAWRFLFLPPCPVLLAGSRGRVWCRPPVMAVPSSAPGFIGSALMRAGAFFVAVYCPACVLCLAVLSCPCALFYWVPPVVGAVAVLFWCCATGRWCTWVVSWLCRWRCGASAYPVYPVPMGPVPSRSCPVPLWWPVACGGSPSGREWCESLPRLVCVWLSSGLVSWGRHRRGMGRGCGDGACACRAVPVLRRWPVVLRVECPFLVCPCRGRRARPTGWTGLVTRRLRLRARPAFVWACAGDGSGGGRRYCRARRPLVYTTNRPRALRNAPAPACHQWAAGTVTGVSA